MINDQVVQGALQAPDNWVDTPEQAQLRACLTTILSGHDPVNTIIISGGIIEMIRNQLLSSTAQVRRIAAEAARQDMSTAELVSATGLTRATMDRLLTEANARSRG